MTVFVSLGRQPNVHSLAFCEIVGALVALSLLTICLV